MPHSVLLHILNEEAIVGEVDRLPEPTDQLLIVKNPHYRDGRSVTYLLPETNIVVYSWSRVHSLEILPGEEEKEKVITFVRE